MKASDIFQKSHIRGNILECIDWSDQWSVLEVSGRDDALIAALASRTKRVTSPLSNALAGDQTYDVMVSIAPCGHSLDELLGYGERLLRVGGKLLFACDNRLGLKYLAGCQREPDGGYFSGIQGEDGERLYLRKELQSKMESVKDRWECKLFYPYPNQYYPMSIYSDRYLPKMGELNANGIISEHARLSLFNEEKAYDTIIKEELYGEMANAFLLVMTRR